LFDVAGFEGELCSDNHQRRRVGLLLIGLVENLERIANATLMKTDTPRQLTGCRYQCRIRRERRFEQRFRIIDAATTKSLPSEREANLWSGRLGVVGARKTLFRPIEVSSAQLLEPFEQLAAPDFVHALSAVLHKQDLVEMTDNASTRGLQRSMDLDVCGVTKQGRDDTMAA
jgi:hypothetical protein